MLFLVKLERLSVPTGTVVRTQMTLIPEGTSLAAESPRRDGHLAAISAGCTRPAHSPHMVRPLYSHSICYTDLLTSFLRTR